VREHRDSLIAAGEIRSSSRTRLVPDQTIATPFRHSIDTLLVAGCPNAAEMSPSTTVTNSLREVAAATRRYGSVCSGAFFLAAAGLLHGKRVTTHWAVASRLAQAYPSVSVDADTLRRAFVRHVGVTPAEYRKSYEPS